MGKEPTKLVTSDKVIHKGLWSINHKTESFPLEESGLGSCSLTSFSLCPLAVPIRGTAHNFQQ